MPNHHSHPQDVHYSLKQEMNELYWASAIKNFAVYMVGIFLVVYVYQYFGESITKTALFYMAQFVMMLVFLPVGARAMSSLGVKRSMAIANPFLAMYIVLLLLAPQLGMLAIVLAIVSKTVYFVLFWMARHVDFARFARRHKEGNQLSILGILIALVKAVAPLLGGFLIARYGFTPALTASAALISVSAIPLFFSPELRVSYRWGWLESYKHVLDKKHRRMMFVFFLEGIESGVRLLIFPLFLFLTLHAFDTIGTVTTLTMIGGIVFTYAMGHLADKRGGLRVYRVTSLMHGAAWIINGFITTPLQYFGFSTFFRLTETSIDLPMMRYVYHRAKLLRRDMDEFIVLREIMYAVGRIVLMAAVALYFLSEYTSFWPFFIGAGVIMAGLHLATKKLAK